LSDKKPDWLKKKVKLNNQEFNEVTSLITDLHLNTVCQSAGCPNIYECFSNKTATFMILGDVCTRNCGFCGIKKGRPEAPDRGEPLRIARAVSEMGLKYVVITSVTRDDLADGGSNQFIKTVREIQKKNPDVKIECLIPDFKGNLDSLKNLLSQNLIVLNHNIETSRENFKKVKKNSNYEDSLNILKYTKTLRPDIFTKSGFMLGLGEGEKEIIELLSDLKKIDCDIITIGQYLKPSENNLPVKKYYSPEEFKKIEEFAKGYGFKEVICGPFVRSSYNADVVVRKILKCDSL